jgi:hypothetical protein
MVGAVGVAAAFLFGERRFDDLAGARFLVRGRIGARGFAR